MIAALVYVYTTTVPVHATRVFIQYSGSASGYLASNTDLNVKPFHPVYGASNYTYPGFTATGLKQETIQLSLLSNSTEAHQIISIQVNTVGFTIISVKPSIKIQIPAQTQALLIMLLVQAPFLGYDGDLELVIVAA